LNKYVPIFEQENIPVLYNFAKGHEVDSIPPEGEDARARSHLPEDHHPRLLRGEEHRAPSTVKCHIYTTHDGRHEERLGGLLNTSVTTRIRGSTALWVDSAIQKESQRYLRHHGWHDVRQRPRSSHDIPVIKDYMLASRTQVAYLRGSRKMMGFDPMSLEFIKVAHDDGLGVGDPRDIELVGDDISRESWGFSVGDNAASKVGGLHVVRAR